MPNVTSARIRASLPRRSATPVGWRSTSLPSADDSRHLRGFTTHDGLPISTGHCGTCEQIGKTSSDFGKLCGMTLWQRSGALTHQAVMAGRRFRELREFPVRTSTCDSVFTRQRSLVRSQDVDGHWVGTIGVTSKLGTVPAKAMRDLVRARSGSRGRWLRCR